MNNPPLVLLVDDNPDNLTLLHAILAPEGFTVVLAQSGSEALQAAGRQVPDLVVLDVMMPKMDGFAVCRRLREQSATRFVPVIMLTALSETEDRIRGLEAGADDFISKPFNDDLLLAKMRSLLRLKQMRDELDEWKRDFAGMVVHDFRVPVHSILGLAELLKENPGLNPGGLRLLEMMEKSARKIDHLISQFLELNKLEAGRLTLNRRHFDLNGLFRKTVEEFAPAGKLRQVKVSFEGAAEPVMVMADPERLEQVLANLLQNACKFSPAGGTVSVVLTSQGGRVRIEVSDQGPGIPAGDRAVIFEKHVQRDQRQGGAGLGLFVSKSVVEAHGGSIWAGQAAGGGARIVFELPLVPL